MATITANTPQDTEAREAGARTPQSAEGGARPQPSTTIADIARTPSPVEAARQRADNLVTAICNEAQIAMERRRDELLNLNARIETSKKALSHYIGEFAAFSAEALTLSSEIGTLIEKASEPFAASPPSTITQLKNGKE